MEDNTHLLKKEPQEYYGTIVDSTPHPVWLTSFVTGSYSPTIYFMISHKCRGAIYPITMKVSVKQRLDTRVIELKGGS